VARANQPARQSKAAKALAGRCHLVAAGPGRSAYDPDTHTEQPFIVKEG